jgi:phage terminase large subunit
MGGTDDRIRELEIVYKPLPSQKRFHDCTKKFKGFSGPVGSGKSQALCQEAIRMAYQNPGRTGLLGAPTYPMLRDATQTTLLEILAENRIAFEHSKGENTLTLKDTRSRILFRPVEDFERLRGTNLAWFGLDELTYTPHDAWNRMVARLRDPKAKVQRGFAVWTPKGFDWVYKAFVMEKTKEYELIQARPQENTYLLKHSPSYYDHLKECYDETFYRQEVLGEYLNLTGGLVYSAFARSQHVAKLELDPGSKLLWALDFNVDPLSSVVVQVDRGVAKVIDEIVIRNASTRDACEAFVERYGKHRMPVEVFGDASGYQHRTSGDTDYDIIKEYLHMHSTLQVKFRTQKSNPSVRERINLVNGRLKSASGESKVLVSEKCKELIQDFEQVAYKEGSGQIDKDRDRMRTHISDALGYLLVEEFGKAGKIGEQQRRMF